MTTNEENTNEDSVESIDKVPVNEIDEPPVKEIDEPPVKEIDEPVNEIKEPPVNEGDEAALNEEASRELEAMVAEAEAAEGSYARLSAGTATASGDADDGPLSAPQSQTERAAVIEALIFVSDEPLSAKTIADVLKEDKEVVNEAIAALVQDFNARHSGLQLREVAGGWQFATRPEYHEHVRAFLKTRPSAKLTIASLETLAVIAYRQPITVPEILEIRGVQSPSSIKTLLDKKLIVAKGRKDTVGRPMMYGTSKEFLLQFGLKDLSELPSVEDFHDLSGGS